MRQGVVLIVFVALIICVSCGTKEELFPKLQKGSEAYTFYKELSKDVPLVDPDKDVLLLETTEFNISTGNVLLAIYQDIFNMTAGDVNKFKNQPRDRIVDYIKAGARRIAENKLMIVEAKKSGFKADEDSVQSVLAQMKKNTGGDEAFSENLKMRNLPEESIVKEIRDNMILEQYLKNKLFADIKVTDDEVMAVYTRDKIASIRHLLKITRDKSDTEKAKIKKQMEDLLAQLKKGADFAKLAKKYSEDPGSKEQGGLIKNVQRGDLFKELDDAIFSLAVGEISDVIESRIGYHIIKVVDREQDPRGFEEAKEEIKLELTEPARKKALSDKIEELKGKYQMKIIATPS